MMFSVFSSPFFEELISLSLIVRIVFIFFIIFLGLLYCATLTNVTLIFSVGRVPIFLGQ